MSGRTRQEIIDLIAALNTAIGGLGPYVSDDPNARDTRNECIALRDRLDDEARSVTARTREQFLTEVRESFTDDEAVEMFGWLWDLHASDPDGFRQFLAEAYARAGHQGKAAYWASRIEGKQPAK